MNDIVERSEVKWFLRLALVLYPWCDGLYGRPLARSVRRGKAKAKREFTRCTDESMRGARTEREIHSQIPLALLLDGPHPSLPRAREDVCEKEVYRRRRTGEIKQSPHAVLPGIGTWRHIAV